MLNEVKCASNFNLRIRINAKLIVEGFSNHLYFKNSVTSI